MAQEQTLTYIGFEVLKVVFDRGEYENNDNSKGFKANIKYSCDTNEENHLDFLSSFVITITHESFPSFSFQMEAFGKFFINSEIEVEPKIYENFTLISAPSIVYPYMRAFVSTFFIQAGLNQMFIPSINFANRRKQMSDSSEEFKKEESDQ